MPSILDGGSGNALSILGAARQFYRGIGLSQRAHNLTSSYLDQSITGLKTILGVGIGGSATVEGAQIQINALRSGTPLHKLSQALQDEALAAAQAQDNGNAAAGANGTNVDEEV